MESLKANMHLFSPETFYFSIPRTFTRAFVGALVAARIAVRHKMRFAMVIGVFFLLGGIASVFMLPSPLWYTILDLGIAYIPFAIIAGKMAEKPDRLV